jgi:AcrR family transcriptional regulator
MASPSERIAAELRAQIARGDLAVGDRVPSTREITRQWGVAVATATRALALLRQDGLVRPVPGVGTIVERPAGPVRRGTDRAPRRRAVQGADQLTTARIVAAAVAIADAEGLDGVSMRRIAVELGTAPMSLYRHVGDKDDLLLRMMDAALREWRAPGDDGSDLRSRLEYAGRSLWTAFRRHRWLAPALSLTRPQPIEGGLAYGEWVLDALEGCGLDLPEMFEVHLTLFNYVRGTAVNLEPEAAAEAASGLDPDAWIRTQEGTLRAFAATGRYPHFERILSADFDLDVDALFERGLGYLLDGLAAALKKL